MIGYSGTGYKGMQIDPKQETIEGELFKAFVKAGAVSKANADDPKKISLVRCARTDKGVHAAGNMISLKLIIEDPDIVEKINAELPKQIRVWGIERTPGSFSCYQAVDSRWYEYLIPSYAFLPPHPSSFLAKKLEEFADEAGDREGYESRQAEVKGFWEEVDEKTIKPIVEKIDEDIRDDVLKALRGEDEANAKAAKMVADIDRPAKGGKKINPDDEDAMDDDGEEGGVAVEEADAPDAMETDKAPAATSSDDNTTANTKGDTSAAPSREARIKAETKKLRKAYVAAKREYRIQDVRVQRIQDALKHFLGTKNYHNYTIQKTFKDPSAKRHIKSFNVDTNRILIGHGQPKDGEPIPDSEKTEWLSLKVHGQSFMMHQIRKMIGMVTLLVRCGADLNTMDASFGPERFSIPKVPGLGLLLDHPVFESYNKVQAPKFEREKLDFDKFKDQIDAFKKEFIYQHIYEEEERENEFQRFFNHVDNFKESTFLFVTSGGLEAVKKGVQGKEKDQGGKEGEVVEAEVKDD
jgi:tRNA pseudouridine38-40 synthase